MEKIVEQTLLYDFYGELLTEHQREVYEDVILGDLGYSEAAQEYGVDISISLMVAGPAMAEPARLYPSMAAVELHMLPGKALTAQTSDVAASIKSMYRSVPATM